MTDIARLQLVIDAKQAEAASRVLDRLESAAKSVEATAKQLERATVRMEQRMKSMTKAVGGAVGEVKAVARAAREAEAGFSRAEREVRKFEVTAERTTKSTRKLFNQFRSLIPLIAGVTGYTAIRGGVLAVADLQDTLAQVQGVAIRTTDSLDSQRQQFRALSQQALELGATTRFTANQAAEGQLYLARTGFTAAQVVEALPATLRLAQAGLLDLGQAADIASNIITQFRLSTSETERVVDAMVMTANRANTSVEQLAVAFTYSGPLAASLGMSIEETAAALGVLGDGGIQASLAGTNLRGVLAGLIDQTVPVTQRLERLARQSGQTADAFNPINHTLLEVIENFNKAGATTQDFAAIFGRRNVAAAIVLAGFSDRLKTLTASIEEAQGEAKRLADLMDQSLKGKLLAAKSAAEALAIALEKSLAGRLIVFIIEGFTKITRELAGFRVEGETVSQTVRVLVAAIQGLIASLAVLGIAKVAIMFVGLAKAIGGAIVAMASLNTVMLANPILFIAKAILVAIGLATAAISYFKDVSVDAFGTTATIGEVVSAVWEELASRLSAIFSFIFAAGSMAFEYLSDNIFKSTKVIVSFFRDSLDMSAGDFERFAKAAHDAQTWMVNRIIGLFDGMFTFIGARIRRLVALWDAFRNLDYSSPGKSMDDLGSAFWNFIDPSKGVMDFARSFNKTMNTDYLGAILGGFESTWEKATDELTKQNPRLMEDFYAALDLSSFGEGVLRRIQEGQAQAIKDAAGLGGGPSGAKKPPVNEEIIAANNAILETLFLLEDEYKLAGLTNAERERAVKMMELESKLRIIHAGDQEKINKELDEFGKLMDAIDRKNFYRKMKDEASDAALSIKEMFSQIDFDMANASKSDLGRAQAESVKSLRLEQEKILAMARGTGSPQAMAFAYGVAEAQVIQLEAAIAKLYAMDQNRILADNFATILTNGLEDAIFSAENLKDALLDVGRALVRLSFQDLAGKPIQAALSSAFGALMPGASSGSGGGGGAGAGATPFWADAKGSAYGGFGRIEKFAKGGMFPAFAPVGFGMADGGLGVLGEGSKPEGVFPLQQGEGGLGVQALVRDRFTKRTQRTSFGVRRMPNGDLGVEAELADGGVLRDGRLQSAGSGGLPALGGYSSRSNTSTQTMAGGGSKTIYMNVQTKDANSFRRSAAQISADLRRSMR